MDTKKYRILNKTREHAVSQGVTLVDSTFEPLTVLRVMVEGLAHNEATGLWLTRISDLPSVPRMAPFDVVYLDKNQSVVEASELLPAARMPRFCKPAMSALILPFQTISATKTGPGDSLEFCCLNELAEQAQSAAAAQEESGATAETDAKPEAAAEPLDSVEILSAGDETIPEPAMLAEATPSETGAELRQSVEPEFAARAAQLLEAALANHAKGLAAEAEERAEPESADSEFAAEAAKVLSAALASQAEGGTEDAGMQAATEADEAVEAHAPRIWEVDAWAARNEGAAAEDVSAATLEAEAKTEVAQGPELDLADALNRALAGVELESAVPDVDTDEETERLLIAAKDEVAARDEESAPFATPAAADLLWSSRLRKRRPGRQQLSKSRKSRAGLRRTEPSRTHFAARQAKELEESELPFLEPSNEPNRPAATPVVEIARTERAVPVVPVPVPNWAERLEPVVEHVIKPAALAPVIEIPSPAVPAAAQVPVWGDSKPDTQTKTNAPAIGRFLRWLYPAVYKEERRGSVRWPAQGLVAYQIRGESMRKLDVGNISSTGIYVLTGDRWKHGDTVLLSLQKNGMPEQRVEHRVEIEAGAVRFGSDGIGLSFALPAGMSLDLWERAMQGQATERGADYIIQEFRMARAMGFLRRICSPVLAQVQAIMDKELSNVRVANAIKILLKTENLLAKEAGSTPLVAHPEVVLRILDQGSWVDVDWIEDIWAGLLATACTPDGQDTSNLPFVEMLSQFAPIHLRILGIASAKVKRGGNGKGLGEPEYCTAGELGKAMDFSNVTKILRTIAELSDYGLLQKAIRSASSPHDSSAQTAVTPLGLQMFARCHGLREVVAPIAWPEVSMVITSPAYSEAANYMVARSAWTESQVARLGRGN